MKVLIAVEVLFMGQKSKVLIVDDNDDMRELCLEFLESDFDVYGSGDAEQVLEIVEDEKIDVVVTDLMMPKKDGFDVINEINASYTEVPVIVLTGYASKENTLTCLRAGAFDLIEKPIKQETFLDSVNRAADHKILLDKRYRWTVAQFCHEISTPITGVLMMTKLIINKLKRVTVEEEWLDEVQKKMQKSLSLTMRLSDIVKESKLSLNDVIKKKSPGILVGDIVRDSLGICDHLLSGIDVNIDGLDEEIQVSCYRVRLTQAIINLVKNAIHAVKTCDEKWISISTQTLDKHFQINIIDSGSGIPEENRESIFLEKFTTKSRNEGTGLGLHIVKKIITDHHGSIELDAKHKNTKFVISLPKD